MISQNCIHRQYLIPRGIHASANTFPGQPAQSVQADKGSIFLLCANILHVKDPFFLVILSNIRQKGFLCIYKYISEVHMEKLHTKNQSSRPSSFIEVHTEMLTTKYQSSICSSFRQKEFRKWSSLFLCSNLRPPGKAYFWSQGDHMNKVGRGPQGDDTYQISKLQLPSFREEEFWNFLSLFLCFNLWPPGGASFGPCGIIWIKW